MPKYHIGGRVACKKDGKIMRGHITGTETIEETTKYHVMLTKCDEAGMMKEAIFTICTENELMICKGE